MTETSPRTEAPEHRLKRLRMRSWRRGTKEMDMILGPFSDKGLRDLSDADVALYDALLEENDHDLYQWVSGQAPTPARFAGLLAIITGQIGA
ncbi:succinate dehydrogenase assembly factor 2 [Alphaproteobacteria bacterium KMM 3653]|uniref:FAD assembly factor SdhE n=1 Tax=Harenicola maris TaxID=2841044 RepID=A0AAP2CS30_9RHOB|nr:succinate dehydrogenase assembly factor 2 [Harenicola maris]